VRSDVDRWVNLVHYPPAPAWNRSHANESFQPTRRGQQAFAARFLACYHFQSTCARGPYPDLLAAQAFVRDHSVTGGLVSDYYGGGGGDTFNHIEDPGSTWRSNAPVQLLKTVIDYATASSGIGYYFFVNGFYVGGELLAYPQTETFIDANTFTVTYLVLRHDDAFCCPSGGTRSLTFHWDGRVLQYGQVIELIP
jgi:LppP/LprE lipoprotein